MKCLQFWGFLDFCGEAFSAAAWPSARGKRLLQGKRFGTFLLRVRNRPGERGLTLAAG
jgi:hypothetical protein